VQIVASFRISDRLSELKKNLSEMAEARQQRESEVELSSVRFVTPLTILPLAAYANHYGLTINCTQDPDSDACRYLDTIRFQEGATNLQSSEKSYLPIRNIPAVEENEILADYEDTIFSLAGLPKAYGLKNSLAVLTSELVANVRQHAKIVDHYWILAQYYGKSTNKTCEIVIADNGRGYKKSFEGTQFEAETDAKAIQNAFEGYSSKPPESGLLPRGYGIRHIANTFINGFHGKLIIISGKSIQYYKENTSKEIELPLGWQGSVVCINFNVKDIDAMDYIVN
jgi:hypothetical protein